MKKIDLGQAKKGALGVLEKTKSAIAKVADQNDDEKFDMQDVSLVASKVGKSVKNGAAALKESAEERTRALELKSLQPIFAEVLDERDFVLPKFIRVANRDKKRAESQVCKGSIGYYSDPKGLRLVNIFLDNLEMFNLVFFPDCNSEFYYVDPIDKNRYIALDDYFNYLKVERISELQRLAQSLGAKHFRVTYKEEKTSVAEKIIKANINVQGVAAGNGERNLSETKFDTIEIAADMECPGHAPNRPDLKYLQKDPAIRTLIDMRMDEHSPLSHQKFMLKLSNSSGLKESDAVKIDAVLKSMRFTGNTSIVSEARNEARRYFEYEIDF
ncbi:MAG: hypothetical protein ACI4IZ_07330 [Acutalibacteraceae bacterium]